MGGSGPEVAAGLATVLGEVDALAGLGGLAGGIEDFGGDHIDLERGESGGGDLTVTDSGEIGQGVVVGGWERGGVELLFRVVADAESEVL